MSLFYIKGNQPMLIDPWHAFTADFGTMPKPWTGFATLIDIAIYLFFCARVSMARHKYKVPAPQTDGPEAFQRVLRVQANTVEQMVYHLPLLWMAAFAMDDAFAAAMGIVWALSRIIYARGYYQKAKRRAKGFLIGLAVNVVLFIAVLAGVVASF
ncbi:MAG: MAPEG family protein [Alphaproteobacteria bacterium]|nr:MAPEG family protein [Alphaproteobacteria bacterium]